MNWRGRYEGGGVVVTSKRWWSRKDRRAARLAAKLCEYQAADLRRASLDAVMYGFAVMDGMGRRIDPASIRFVDDK